MFIDLLGLIVTSILGNLHLLVESKPLQSYQGIGYRLEEARNGFGTLYMRGIDFCTIDLNE
jgi:hypothetical protein